LFGFIINKKLVGVLFLVGFFFCSTSSFAHDEPSWLHLKAGDGSNAEIKSIYQLNNKYNFNAYHELSEFLAKHAGTSRVVDMRLLNTLNAIRQALVSVGVKRPVFVILPLKTTAVRNDSTRFYKEGKAVLFYVPGIPSDVLYNWLKEVNSFGNIGLGLYQGEPNFLHLDTRDGSTVFWVNE
jgi:hypothetical protein